MIFTSFSFLIFLICVTAAYFICPVKYRWGILLVSSIVFYCLADVKFLPFILATSAISYLIARMIQKEHENCDLKVAESKNKEEIKILRENSRKKCRRMLQGALIVILGYLALTKFGKTVFDWISNVSGNAGFSVIHIIVPLGISYYSFSNIGYVLDIYWKRYKPEKNFLKYLLYVMYFPHILQGPIARFDRLGVQFSKEHPFDYQQFCFGIQLIIWGFFQKLVIADRVGIFVSAVYNDYANQYGMVLLVATLMYAVQIYADFAGCVNIARGVSQIFGIDIENNFSQPYFSKSVDEFWRRWHITLGAWFKDYLCMPVSVSKPVKDVSKKIRKKFGSRAGKNTTTIAALAAVWICTGVWHGTGLNYVVWGIWQGGIIAISVLLEPYYGVAKSKLHINDQSKVWQLFQMCRTFVLTGIIPRVIVRASSIGAAWTIFKNFFADLNVSSLWNGSLLEYGLSKENFVIAGFAIAVLFVVSLLKEKGVSIRESIGKRNIVVRWLIYIAAFYSVVILGIYGPGYDASAFVYMDF